MRRDEVAGAVALAAVLALLIGIGLYRIPAVDMPWHLATGRLLASGVVPTTNTFSWTYPDWPLHQQYPLYQLPAYLVQSRLGWEALSLANAAAWTAAVLLWMGWAGGWSDAARQPLVWLLVVMGVQRHHLARPEVITIAGLGLLLVCLDRWRLRDGGPVGARSPSATPPTSGSVQQPDHRRWALAGVVLAQWVMVNGHQLWPLGIAVQVAFLVHLALSRHARRLGLSDEDRALPLGPPAVALVASVAVLASSPLGPRTWLAPLTAVGTVLAQGAGESGGAQANELQSVFTDPLATLVAAGCLLLAAFTVLRRRYTVAPFDLAVWIMGLLLVLIAVRGIPFFALATGGLVSRAHRRAGPLFDAGSPVPLASSVVALVLCVGLLRAVLGGEPSYYATQRGIGRSVGEWGEATTRYLREDPPPGSMLNLGWAGANPLIYAAWPAHPVFVDPRWESYPRAFLLRAIAAQDSDPVLAELIEEHRPGFVVAEMRLAQTQRRAANLVLGGGWAVVHADSEFVVLAPTGTAYTERRRIAPAQLLPVDLLGPEWPVLRAQQQARVARLLVMLGERAAAAPLLAEARRRADHPSVAADLAAVPP